jgi:hypothetical protein
MGIGYVQGGTRPVRGHPEAGGQGGWIRVAYRFSGSFIARTNAMIISGWLNCRFWVQRLPK